MRAFSFLLLSACMAATGSAVNGAEESAKVDATYPFRTDFANEHLPWYQLKPGEFPPLHSDHRVGGELLEADFIHRCGQFRLDGSGELVDFALLPFGAVRYLNAEADLRDVPLGTHFVFSLYQDEQGQFTKAADMQDEFTLLASQGVSYRLAEVKAGEGKLAVVLQNVSQNQADLGHTELQVNEQTRVWKGDKQISLSDLAVGDELLVNLAGAGTQTPVRCIEIWVGGETHKLATERQRKRRTAFLKTRGLPAWIDRVDGKKLTVTLFGVPADMQALFKDQGIVAAQWATEHRQMDAVVATAELRTYNPPVDRQRSMTLEYQSVPTDCYGSSGVRWVIQPNLLIEGFRKGRIIRLFAHPSWPVNDMAFGEGVYTEAPGARNEVEEPLQYPYRTDFANQHLPWYRLQPGKFAPFQSQHVVSGELVKIDPVHRSGQFRTDGTGELVDFAMPPFGSALLLSAEADLGDLPLGIRYHFYMHPDDQGKFTKASVILDEYTHLASEKFTWRFDAANLAEGKLFLARQHALVKNDKEAMVRPPDYGRAEFAVDATTRVHKGDQLIQLSDLAAGDELLFNLTGRTANSRGRLTDIWVGLDTHKLVSDAQRTKYRDFIRERGLPAWIEKVEGKTFTIMFFSGSRRDFGSILDGDPWGKDVFVSLVDDELRPQTATVDKMHFKNHLPEEALPGTFGTYGSSGAVWVIEADQLPAGYREGQAVRVFKEGWPIKDVRAEQPSGGTP